MSIKGQSTIIWTGWLIGIIFLKKPWGPFHVSWISLHTLWAIFLLLAIIPANLDAAQNVVALESTISDKDSLIHYVNMAMQAGVHLRSVLIRIILIIHAKSLAQLLTRLYSYSIHKETIANWSTPWIWFYIIYWFSILLIIAHAVILALIYGNTMFEHSWFNSIGVITYWFLILFTVSITDFTTFVAFFLITSITFQQGMIFVDFCDSLRAELSNWDFSSSNVKANDGMVLREYFLQKLDDIQDLFDKANSIVSLLVLVLVSLGVFQLIPSLYGIFALESNGRNALLVKASFSMTGIQQIVVLGLVCVGQFVYDKIEQAKERLGKILILIPQRASVKREYETTDIATLTMSFKWNLSACQFFTVDLRLIAGIMATAMSYIVILVQMQLTFN